jgi:hypothetical protein
LATITRQTSHYPLNRLLFLLLPAERVRSTAPYHYYIHRPLIGPGPSLVSLAVQSLKRNVTPPRAGLTRAPRLLLHFSESVRMRAAQSVKRMRFTRVHRVHSSPPPAIPESTGDSRVHRQFSSPPAIPESTGDSRVHRRFPSPPAILESTGDSRVHRRFPSPPASPPAILESTGNTRVHRQYSSPPAILESTGNHKPYLIPRTLWHFSEPVRMHAAQSVKRIGTQGPRPLPPLQAMELGHGR